MTVQHTVEEHRRRSHLDDHREQKTKRGPGGTRGSASLLSATAEGRLRAAILAVAPAVMLAGFLYHPHIANLGDAAAVAAALTGDPTRWAVAHLTIGVGSGLVILAFLAIRSWLREAGDRRWSGFAVPFIGLGSTLFAMLPGLEFAPLAAALAGGDVEATQIALDTWFVPLLVTAAVIFAVGAIGFAVAILRSAILRGPLAWLIPGALVVIALARFVPLTVVQFQVQGAAFILAMWPLSWMIWREASANRS